MKGWSDARGQATSEYVALVALVAVALALAAGLTSGGVAGHVLAGLQRGLCRVAGTVCVRSQPPAADLAPCPLERTTRRESLDGAFAVVTLGDGGTLSAVRLSDGRVVLSMRDEKKAGVEVGVGLHVSIAGRRGSEATAGVSASIGSGRSWTLQSVDAARDFIARHGSQATVGGHAVDAARSACSILCDAIGWRPHAELPPADELYMSEGLAAALKVPLPPGLPTFRASGGALLGTRVGRDGSSTWFLQLDSAVGAEVVRGPGTATLGHERQAVVSYTLDAQKRPVELVIHTVVRNAARGALRGARRGTSAGAAAGGVLVTELDATLDLHDARNRAVAEAFVGAFRDPLAIGALAHRAVELRERVEQVGVVDRRTYALSSSALQLGAKVALGEEVGADFERAKEGMRLLSADTRLPGLPFLPRDDCRSA
jgi:hypothetical protein